MSLLVDLLIRAAAVNVFSYGTPAKQCLLDLSHGLDDNTICWVAVKSFRVTKISVINKPVFVITKDFEMGEHCSTHLDAPYHFNRHGWKIGQIPTDRLFVRGIVIRARKEAKCNPNYALPASKFTDWVKKYGPLTSKTVILVDFGWAEKYSDKNLYYGSKTLNESDLNFPGLSKEAAQWIADNDQVVGVGVDMASADPGNKSLNPEAHVIITKVNKYMVENLALCGVDLPDDGFSLTLLPMKITKGTGAPVRVIASISCKCNKN